MSDYYSNSEVDDYIRETIKEVRAARRSNEVFDVEVPPTNRERAKKPTGSGYCWGCDAYVLWDGVKCPVCGHKEKTKKVKPGKYKLD